MSIYVTDLTIKLKKKSRYYNLPYATGEVTPTFRWDLPYSVTQAYYCFEMRTLYPKTLSTGEYLCAYYSSGKIRSSAPEHTVSFALNGATWNGCVEVRLRIFDEKGNVYSSHKPIGFNENVSYDFERDNPQGFWWYANRKKYYFCFDTDINAFLNVFNFNYYFQRVNDYNNQELTYTMQVSDSPLFNDVTDNEAICLERKNISFVGNSISIVGAFQKENENKPIDFTSLAPNKMYYIRVRAYDGYDYSDWSLVNAFYSIESEVPVCYIKNVDTVLAGEERPYGEVRVTVQVIDKDNDFVNAYFCFSMPTTEAEASRLGVAKNESINALSYEEEMASINSTRMIRARFKESTLSMPTNKDIVLTWMTNNEIIGTIKNNVYLYMIAEDTYSPSSPVNYGPISINNTKIGIGAATSPAISFNIRSDLQFHFRYLQLPDTILRTRHNLKQSELSYGDKPEKGRRESSGDWLDFWNKNEQNSQSFALTVKDGKFYSVCPNCDYTYRWVYDTYDDKSGWALVSTSYNEMELITETIDRNTVQFRCKKCGKVYPMEWRYRPDLHFGTNGCVKKTNYALYHGYNSDFIYDEQMELDLELMRKSEYKELYGEDNKDAPKFNQIETLKENIKNNDGSDAEEGWGYIGKSPLLTMKRRPDIDAYHHVIPPNPKQYHYAVYVDGQALHMDLKKDYMTDFEDKEENERIIPGDKSMQELAKQEPWKSLPEISEIYTGYVGKEERKDNEKKRLIYCESGDSVVYYSDGDQPYFFYRAILYAKSEFPFTIERNVNDRYMIQINDEFFSGSILEDGEDSRFVSFISDNSYKSIWTNFYNKVLGRAFSFAEIFDINSNRNTASIKYYGKNDEKIKRIKLFPALMDKIKTDKNGNPVLDEEGNEIHEIQDVSCYKTLGIGYFEAYQNWHYIKKGTEVRCELFGDKQTSTGKYYWYSEIPNEKGGKYEIAESEANNDIDDFQVNKGKQGNQQQTNVSAARKITFENNTNTSLVNWSGRTLRINHDMNCYPFVMLYDNQNKQVFYDTKFVNKNSIHIYIPAMSGTWTAILGYGVPYGKTQYVTDTFYSKLINFTNSNSSNVTWQNGKAIINHKMNCYPAIMLYDGNQIQSFFGAKVLDGNNISIDFKNLSNVNGDWRIILNKTYDYNNGRDDEQCKRIVFTSENDTFVSWNGNEATFTHGLNCYPIISIYDENMELALFEVRVQDENRISVNFGDKNAIRGSWTLFALKTLGYNESSQEVAYNSSGEPLFTCYLDEVDKEGNHFPYTEQDYYKTKKIYIRTKHYEICNPFEHPVYGYRNWIVEPILGKEGRYRKKKVLNARGLPAEKRYVATKDEENHVIYEFGWFNPATNECVSHEKEDDTFTDKGEQIYTAKTDNEWQNEIMTQVCIVYDYVDYQQAIIKNPTDTLQYHPLNHKSSILLDGEIEKYRFDKKYGLYILGEYSQRKIDTFGNQIVYDGDKVVLRYPNGEFVYSESDCQLYRKNGRVFWYDLNGREQDENPEDYAIYSVPATELKIYDNNGIKLEYDQKGNQYLKMRKRFDTEYDIDGHFVYNYKLDDRYVYDNEGHRILRDNQGEFYFMDSHKVYVEGFEKISVPIVSMNENAYSFNTEVNDSSTFKCTVLTENGKQAYEYNGDEIALDEQGNKKKIYNEQTKIKRFNETWSFKKEENYLFSELVIDNEVPKFYSKYGIFLKYGYQPEKCLEPYFKEDETKRYEGQSIAKSSIYVHGICEEPWGDLRIGTRFQTLTTLISDKTLEDVGTYLYDNFYYHEEKGVFYKGELIDYRLYGNHIWDLKNYFSGLPRDEHIAYSIRPDVVYREDRPWRIISAVSGLENYGKWSFLYLQSTWNAYNRIHWNFTAATGEYVILTAVELINGSEGTPFSVRTKRSIWDNDLNMWCIPFSDTERNSDMIDTLNNTNFINGHYYRFYIKTINKSNGVESAESPYSITFTTSPEAVSPASITEMNYDPWTKRLMVKFRLDDAQGRKYDVTEVKYSIQDPVIGKDNSEGTWYDIPLNMVEGELNSLGSNTRGDNVPSNNYITYHTIYIDLNQIGSIVSADFRIRIITEIAANRTGLTIPNFHAKMWVNEFLDPVEKTIYSLGGTWNRWIWKSQMNYETGEDEGEWIYLDKPIWQNGKIQETQESLDKMDNDFENWYASVAKFRYPDMDAFEYYLHTAKDVSGKVTQYELFYYNYFFDDYIDTMQLREQYLEYKKNAPMSYTVAKTNQSFIEDYYQTNLYKSFYTLWREKYLSMKMQDMKNTDFMIAFLAWYEENKSESYAHARQLYMDGYRLDASGDWDYNEDKALWDKYDAFWAEDSSASSDLGEEEYEDEESSSSDYEMTEDDKIIAFLKSEKLEKAFENYYVQLYMYPDTRFSEREQLVGDVYDEFETWLESPEDEYGNTLVFDYFDDLPDNSTLGNDRYISEQYIYFLKWAKANGILDNISVINNGKNTARIAFMQLKKNGISYGQSYQSLTASKQNYYKQLEEAQNKKTAIETDHRKNLVSQGFFSNGFLNNKPYKNDEKTNIAFRFRVETQPYEGSITDYMQESFAQYSSLSDLDDTIDYGGYDERWDVYFRVQMDFYDTYNSQPDLKPLRDFIYIGTKSDKNRIKAAIGDADNSAKTTPVSTVNTEENLSEVATNERTKKQFAASWTILKKDLPGEYETDVVPYAWGGESFEQLYFWRVAPYNLVKRPVFESMSGLFTTPVAVEYENGFIPETYHSYTVNNVVNFNKEHVENNAQGVIHTDYPPRPNQSQNQTRLYKMEAYLDNSFAHEEITESFMQSRSVYMEYKWLDNRTTNDHKAQYFIYLPTSAKNVNGTWTKDVNDSAFNPQAKPYASEWVNQAMLNRGEVQFVTDRPRKFAESEEESSSSGYESSSSETGKMEFIKDNIENFDTKWVLWNVERGKPNVIRYKDHYLLFSHKHDATRSINGHLYAENYIIMSRGFDPNIFGEECITFPRYSNYRPSQIIPNALSFENPSVCFYNSTYYMYFNVLFYDKTNNEFYTEIYRAETLDMDNWTNFTKVNIKYQNHNILNVGEPNVLIIREVEYASSSSDSEDEEITETYRPSFHLFASAKLTEYPTSIHYWISDDGINFEYKEEIAFDITYGFYSPSVIIDDRGRMKVYFSIENNTHDYGIIASVKKDHDLYYQESHQNDWQPVPFIEKANSHRMMSNFNGIRRWDEEGSYLKPCVLYDNHYGYQVMRIYYNSYDNPYVYDKTNDLILNEFANELTIHTEYLEQYQWKQKELREFADAGNNVGNAHIDPISVWDGENWVNITYNEEGNINEYNPNFRLPKGLLRFQWFDTVSNIPVVKISSHPVNNYIRCLSQAPWIDFYNVANTEAIIYPEILDDTNYKLTNYKYSDYMLQEDLFEAYNEWLGSLPQEEKMKYANDYDASYLAFLTVTQKLGNYMWWSRKGNGVYRHLNILKKMDYNGAIEEERE